MTLFPMENRENILCALKCFEQEKSTIPPILEDYIKQIAKNGQTLLPWVYLKPLLLTKFNEAVDSFTESNSENLSVLNTSHYNELKEHVCNILSHLDGICELFENPKRHYQRVDKYLRGLEKVLMVVSTVDPYGNKIHQEDPRFPSQAGLDECSVLMNGSFSSPSNSPNNILQYNQMTKSDEEVTEEEEEDAEEGSDDGSDEGHNLATSTSLMTRSPVASSWFFKTNDSTSLPTTPIKDIYKGKIDDHMIGTVSYKDFSSNQDEIQSVNTTECKLDSESSSDSFLQSDDQNSNESTQSESVSSDEQSFKDGVIVQNSPKDDRDQTSSIDLELNEDNIPAVESSEYKSPKKEFSSIDTSLLSTMCSVPHVLRPIGQLEAFVQNLTSEAASLPTFCSPTNSDKESSDVTNLSFGNSPTQAILETGIGKRRAESPELTTQTTTATTEQNNPVDFLESPAKKRKLDDDETNIIYSDFETISTPQKPTESGMNSSSPPIILCDPPVFTDSGADDENAESVAPDQDSSLSADQSGDMN